MKQKIHREKFMFEWITKNHKLVSAVRFVMIVLGMKKRLVGNNYC